MAIFTHTRFFEEEKMKVEWLSSIRASGLPLIRDSRLPEGISETIEV